MRTSRFRSKRLQTALGRVAVATRGFVADLRSLGPGEWLRPGGGGEELPFTVAAGLEDAGAEERERLEIGRTGRSLLALARLLRPRARPRERIALQVPTAGEPVAGVSTTPSGVVRWHLGAGEAPGAVRVDVPGPATAGEALRRMVSLRGERRRVHLFSFRPGGGAETLARVEAVLKPHEGIKRFPRARPPFSVPLNPFPRPVELRAEGRTLLLVHGIFDQMVGAAFGCWTTREHAAFRDALEALYGGRVYCFDHRTASRLPLDNARDLARLLPDGLDLDIVCHSRGALVVRGLLEHPEVAPELEGRGVRVGTAVLVGAASQGSELASRENWEHLLSVLTTTWEDSRLPGAAAAARLAAQVARHAIEEASAIPGFEALSRGSGYVRALNEAPGGPRARYAFVRGELETARPVLRELDAVADQVFRGRPNDLVVSFDAMADVGPRSRDDWPACDTDCHHLDYFTRDEVQEFILRVLREGLNPPG